MIMSSRARRGALFSTLVLALSADAQPDKQHEQQREQREQREEAQKQKENAAATAVLAAPVVAPVAAPVAADGSVQPPVKTADGDVEVAPDSPRMVVHNFLEMVQQGKEAEAARYLEMSDVESNERAAELARELAAVLESQPTFDLEQLSPAAMGDLEDGLPSNRERVGGIKVGKGTVEPVRMVRHSAVEEWVFTKRTVKRIPAWYNDTPSAWAQNNLPPWLSKRGPVGMHYWQWFAFLALVVISWGIGFLFSRVVSRGAAKLVKKTTNTWDDALVEMLQGPVTLACSLGVAAAILPWLALPEIVGSLLYRGVKGGFLVVFFWLCLKAVDVGRNALSRARFANDRPASRSLLSLGARFTKAALFVVLIIAVLSMLGLPVGSLLAGLGIGGLAVALAGQKTLENLIGTFAIAIDQPFREGDFVKVRDFQATVEAIGLRSTRFRTLDRTIITVPNGKISDEQLETYAARDRMRLFAALPIRYGSTAEQLRSAIGQLEADLKSKWPRIDASSVTVRLTNLGEWSMGVNVSAMVNTIDGAEYDLLKQDVLLHVLTTLEATGVKMQPIELVNASNSVKGANGSAPRSLNGNV